MTSETSGRTDSSHQTPAASSTPAAALDELERAELLTHTQYPRLGPWYPPLAGALVGIYIASIAAPFPFSVVGMLLVVSIATGGVTAYSRRRGVTPNVLKSPSEIQRVMVGYVVAFVAFCAGCAVLWFQTTWWITAIVASLVATVGIWFYERKYAEAARAAEAHLGSIADAAGR